jgi:hypothetical protein
MSAKAIMTTINSFRRVSQQLPASVTLNMTRNLNIGESLGRSQDRMDDLLFKIFSTRVSTVGIPDVSTSHFKSFIMSLVAFLIEKLDSALYARPLLLVRSWSTMVG